MAQPTLQFQSRHGQRQLPVLALSMPWIFVAGTLGGVLVDGDGWITGVSLPLAVAQVVFLLVYGVRRRRYGLEVGPGWVGRNGPLGPGHLAQEVGRPSPQLARRRSRDVESLRVTDFQGSETSVPWLVHVLTTNGWQKSAYGIPNDLLVRQPFSDDPAARRWTSTGLVWTDDNGAEIVAYLQGRIDAALREQPHSAVS